MPTRVDLIKKVVHKDGSVRYRFAIDVGPKPNGKRDQRLIQTDVKRGEIRYRSRHGKRPSR